MGKNDQSTTTAPHGWALGSLGTQIITMPHFQGSLGSETLGFLKCNWHLPHLLEHRVLGDKGKDLKVPKNTCRGNKDLYKCPRRWTQPSSPYTVNFLIVFIRNAKWSRETTVTGKWPPGSISAGSSATASEKQPVPFLHLQRLALLHKQPSFLRQGYLQAPTRPHMLHTAASPLSPSMQTGRC